MRGTVTDARGAIWTATLRGVPDWGAYSGNTRPGHYMAEARNVRAMKDYWGWVLKADAVKPERPIDRYQVNYIFACQSLRRVPRDWDNIMRATKPLTDALVEAGVLVGDSRAHMVSVPNLEVRKGPLDLTIVTVTAVERLLKGETR